MHGTDRKRLFDALFFIALTLTVANRSEAAVTFAASGGDLVVTIDAPIEFIVLTGSVSSQFAVNFEDVYTVGNSDHHGDMPSSGTSTMTLPGGVISDGLETWSDTEFTLGLLDPTDFYATYYFNSPRTLLAGDVVTISAGVMVIPDFIANGGVVPDAPAKSAHFFDEGLNDLSAPMAVPEAGTAVLGGLALLGLLRRRR